MGKKDELLFKSCCSNNVKGVEKALKNSLFSKGAEVNEIFYNSFDNPDGNSFLQIAAKNGNAEIATLLIAAGARINVYNQKEENPLQLSAQGGNIEIGKMLIGKGADVNEHKDVTSEPIEIALDNENTGFATLLTENGVDIKSKTRALLNWAAKYNKPKSVKWLIETGYNINEEDYSNKTVLFEAVENGSFEVARSLIELGANVNTTDKAKKSPLYYAVEKGDIEMARLLLENGTIVNNDIEGGNAPIHIATNNNKAAIVDLLLTRDNISATSLLTHARGDIETIKVLVKHGADINFVTMSGSFEPRSMLNLAIDTKNIQLAKVLVEMGGHLIYETGGKKKFMFTEAIKLGNTGLTDLMLAHGAEINENGSAPLSEAFRLHNKEMVDFLINKGAVPNDKTRALYNEMLSQEKLQEELKNIPDSDLYHALLSNDFIEFKKHALERYINAFPDQFALDKCKSGKNIIAALINLKKPAEDKKEGCTLSDLIRSYGKLIESAYLIMAKSSEFRVVVGHSSSSGDYETTITRCGEDTFQTEEVMTYWN